MSTDIIPNIDLSVNPFLQSYASLRVHNIWTLESFDLRNVSNLIAVVAVSTKEQAANGYSLDWQQTDLLSALSSYGVRPASIERYAGDSHRERHLPNLAKMAGPKGCIVALYIDRLIRPWPPSAEQLSFVQSLGVPLVSIMPIELSHTSQRGMRVRRSIAVKTTKDAGELRGRPAYRNQSALNLIIERLGDSWRAIAAALNEAGIPTQTGKQWDHSSTLKFWRQHFTYEDRLGIKGPNTSMTDRLIA
jgi:hypothetical protein